MAHYCYIHYSRFTIDYLFAIFYWLFNSRFCYTRYSQFIICDSLSIIRNAQYMRNYHFYYFAQFSFFQNILDSRKLFKNVLLVILSCMQLPALFIGRSCRLFCLFHNKRLVLFLSNISKYFVLHAASRLIYRRELPFVLSFLFKRLVLYFFHLLYFIVLFSAFPRECARELLLKK
jgi:hypothetical protein